MKRYLTLILVVLVLMGSQVMAHAQDKKQEKNVHIRIDEGGKVIKDTSFTVQSNMSSAEIDKLIQTITGNHMQIYGGSFSNRGIHDSIFFGDKEIPIGKIDSILSEHFMDFPNGEPFDDFILKFGEDSLKREYIPEMPKRNMDSCLHLMLDDPNFGHIVSIQKGNGNLTIIHKPMQGEKNCLKELKEIEKENPKSQNTTQVIIRENTNAGNKKEVIEKVIIYGGGVNNNLLPEKKVNHTVNMIINKT
jgi:hypothetical protein